MQNQKTISEAEVISILSNIDYPDVTDVNMAFPRFNVPNEIIEMYGKINPRRGIKEFNRLFFSGGKIKPKKGIEGTWKEKALVFALALKGSFLPKHEYKEFACGLIFEHTLIL